MFNGSSSSYGATMHLTVVLLQNRYLDCATGALLVAAA
jgi:hypothetical protein